MGTVASPVSIREQALATLARHLVHPASPIRRLAELGDAVLADLLIDLEGGFDIDLDADEVLPGLTVAALLDLVELKALAAQAAAHAGKVFHWDDERARRDLPLCRPRPRPALASPPGALAPPQWPLVYPEPRPRKPPVAVPSDAAWARAERLHARARARRARLLWLALACAVAAEACAAAWLRLAGLA